MRAIGRSTAERSTAGAFVHFEMWSRYVTVLPVAGRRDLEAVRDARVAGRLPLLLGLEVPSVTNSNTEGLVASVTTDRSVNDPIGSAPVLRNSVPTTAGEADGLQRAEPEVLLAVHAAGPRRVGRQIGQGRVDPLRAERSRWPTPPGRACRSARPPPAASFPWGHLLVVSLQPRCRSRPREGSGGLPISRRKGTGARRRRPRSGCEPPAWPGRC